ncbi:MAG: hypothetical protein ACXWBN_00030 [Acidimicrobiales bacterium]
MRPTVRRIDLTQTPTAVEVWPSLDWLEPTGAPRARRRPLPLDAAPTAVPSVGGPHGRSGLWDAMASAVQRARESSLGESIADHDDTGRSSDIDGADVIEMTVDTPHLAYLARVACSSGTGRDDLPGADVIAFVDARTADAG